MGKSYKASNFLNVIDKYAKRQKANIIEEIKSQEEIAMRKAEAEIIEDAEAMINKELINMKNKVAIEVSRKELEERKKISRRRKEIMKDMFKECHKRLVEFTLSEDYKQFLKQYSFEISKVLTGNDTELYVKESDLKYEKIIKEGFDKPCKVYAAKDILIGGIRGYSLSKKIIADETLDAKLKEQEDWAAENFGILLV